MTGYIYDKYKYQTLSWSPENVQDIYQMYMSNVQCPAWIYAPEELFEIFALQTFCEQNIIIYLYIFTNTHTSKI